MTSQAFTSIIESFELDGADLLDAMSLASRYLAQYGYLEQQAAETLSVLAADQSPLVEALHEFRSFHGLDKIRPSAPLAALLSREVLVKMRAPRCAFRDQRSARGLSKCRWRSRKLSVRIMDSPRNRDRALTDIQAAAAVRQAFDSWASLSQGGLQFKFCGSGSADIEVVWINTGNTFSSHVGDVVGDADLPPNCSEHQVLPKRIRLDGIGHRWITGDSGGSFDIRSVVVHEIGHILGFDHAHANVASVMAPDYRFNQRPDPFDEDALNRRYPPARLRKTVRRSIFP